MKKKTEFVLGQEFERVRILKIIDKWLSKIPRNVYGEKPITPEDLSYLSNKIRGDEE